jgi:CheY-like chemotaxis protein/HPt (histidine-containing phosphotransfer) domain-containing protein
MANSRIRDKGLMLQTEIADDIPEKLYGDERCIRQVLINLLSNAIKYTAEGFVMLRVGSVRLPEDVIRLSFAVEDSGIGIKKENLESVFHEFQRPSQRVKNTYVEGTGLGLPIAQSYCRLMGGEVTVRSVYGQGSTFTATILQKVLSQSPMDLLAYQAEMRKREERFVPFIAPDVEMLVVDDIETNLMVASGLLAPFQFKVFTCKSGEEALNLAKGKRFDLMLIDHMMPKMDGVETLKRLRESQYGQKGVPAIAFTANAIVGTRDKLLSKGFDDFISKPIDSDGLATLLQKWVPKERQLPPPQEKGAKDYISDDDALTIGLPIIEGVDTQAGYHRSGGTTSKYLALLKVFRHDARAAIDNLEREAEGNPKLDDLSVIFHGMKSASGNIGAKDFSDRALKLELKAKSEDRAYLTKDRILAFRDRLIKLLSAIEKGVEDFGRDNKIYLSDQGAEREGLGNGGNGDFLEREPQAIMELKDALEQKDVGKADRLLEELDKGSTDERRKLYQEASDLVLVSDFQGALDIINKVNKDVNYGSTNI